jgi:hypothetical protein
MVLIVSPLYQIRTSETNLSMVQLDILTVSL